MRAVLQKKKKKKKNEERRAQDNGIYIHFCIQLNIRLFMKPPFSLAPEHLTNLGFSVEQVKSGKLESMLAREMVGLLTLLTAMMMSCCTAMGNTE